MWTRAGIPVCRSARVIFGKGTDMCLVMKKCGRNVPRTAKRGIKCYKVVATLGNSVRSPYYEYIYNVGEICSTYMQELCFYIVSNGFHSFMNAWDASELLDMMNSMYRHRTFRLAECQIPKGAVYYKGMEESSLLYRKPGYVSDKIIIKQII